MRQGTTTLLPAFIGSTARYLDDYSGSSRPLLETTDRNGISEKLIRRHHALASAPRSKVNRHAAPPPEAYFPVPAHAGSTIIKPAIQMIPRLAQGVFSLMGYQSGIVRFSACRDQPSWRPEGQPARRCCAQASHGRSRPVPAGRRGTLQNPCYFPPRGWSCRSGDGFDRWARRHDPL